MRILLFNVALAIVGHCRYLPLNSSLEDDFKYGTHQASSNPQVGYGISGRGPILSFSADARERKETIEDGLEDVHEMVQIALLNWDEYNNILQKWLPNTPTRHNKMKEMFKRIAPNNNKQWGTAFEGNLYITERDFLNQCQSRRDMLGYTLNTSPSDAWIHLCNDAFSIALDIAPSIDALDCDNFFINERYRVTVDMEAIPNLILHELMHYNDLAKTVWDGEALPRTTQTETAYIKDQWGRNGYGPFACRRMARIDPDSTSTHAESYTWAITEMYWTWKCRSNLANQGGWFADPEM